MNITTLLDKVYFAPRLKKKSTSMLTAQENFNTEFLTA